jgi:hypothetical protein
VSGYKRSRGSVEDGVSSKRSRTDQGGSLDSDMGAEEVHHKPAHMVSVAKIAGTQGKRVPTGIKFGSKK